MADLLLLRHGQSTFNAEARWTGQCDPPLTPRGEDEARLAAARLRDVGIEAIVTSDLDRARQTATLLADALGLPDPSVEPRLRERSVGEWEGLTFDEIEAGWPGLLEEYRAGRLATAPGGEAVESFRARIEAGLLDIGGRHDGARVVVVAHGGVLRTLDRVLGVEPMRPVNCSGRWLTVEQGAMQPGACWFPSPVPS